MTAPRKKAAKKRSVTVPVAFTEAERTALVRQLVYGIGSDQLSHRERVAAITAFWKLRTAPRVSEAAR